MNLIAAADKNWGIGYQGRLLVSIPSDLKFFRKMTLGKVVVMGRKTLQSLPGGLPLAGRVNIILTSNINFHVKGVIVVHDFQELCIELKKYASDNIFVIGGASVFRELMPYCVRAYITRIDFSFQADAFFPDLDRDEDWEIKERSEEHTCFDIVYHFVRYERKTKKDLP